MIAISNAGADGGWVLALLVGETAADAKYDALGRSDLERTQHVRVLSVSGDVCRHAGFGISIRFHLE